MLEISRKQILEIELFFIPDEGSNYYINGEFKLTSHDRNLLISNIRRCANEFKNEMGFRCIYRDYNFDFSSPNINIYKLESNITDELELEFEIRLKLNLIDEASKKRLLELGYDEREVKEEYKEMHVFPFFYAVCDGKRLYKKSSYIKYVIKYGEKLLVEFRKKEALYTIRNESYRKWLMDQSYIHYDDIIIGAPIDISEKTKMLHGIEKDKKYQRYTSSNHCRDALLQYEAAQKLINDDSPVSAYVLHEKLRVNENGNSLVKERVTTHRTFQQVKDTIADKYNGDEPDEFENRWNIVERFDLIDGNYVKIALFLVSEKGDIWHVRCENANYDYKGHEFKAYAYFTNLELQVPFKRLDIVKIDRRPFNEPCHVIIISECEEYTVSPFCLRKTDEGLEFKWCCSFEEDFFGISPHFSMELFEGDMPENEKILGAINKRIKEDDEFLRKLQDVLEYNKPEETEKMVWKLLAE